MQTGMDKDRYEGQIPDLGSSVLAHLPPHSGLPPTHSVGNAVHLEES